MFSARQEHQLLIIVHRGLFQEDDAEYTVHELLTSAFVNEVGSSCHIMIRMCTCNIHHAAVVSDSLYKNVWATCLVTTSRMADVNETERLCKSAQQV